MCSSCQDFRLATRNIVQGRLFKALQHNMVEYSLMFLSMVKDKKTIISTVKDKKTVRPTRIYKAWLIKGYSLEGCSSMN